MQHAPLTRNNEFARVYAKGKSFVHPHMVLYVCKNRAKHTRVGLTASKKVGNAVMRNRARRVMRAALQSVVPLDVGAVDLVLVARALTPHLKSTQLEHTLRKLCAKAGVPTKDMQIAGKDTPAGADLPAGTNAPAATQAKEQP